MSAVNIVLQGATAHVLTDGAGYHPTEVTLVSRQQKVYPIAPLSMALAVRGSTGILPILAGYVNELHDSFDDVVRGFAGTHETMVRLNPGCQWLREPHEVFVVGISEADQTAEAYAFVNDPMYGLPVNELIALSEGLVLPGDLPFLESLTGLGLDPAGPFDAARDGLRLLRAQRERAWPMGVNGAQVRAVGGFAQLTTITAEAVTTRVLERWDDKVGEKIAA